MTDPASSALLDLPRLSDWLSAHLPGFRGPIEAEKFASGQSNPTFRLITGSARYVLRRKPPGVLLKSAHAIEREFRVQQALAGSAVPVARMHLLCEDASIIGSPFYLMDEISGRHFDDPRLEGETPVGRRAIYDEMNRVLAAIHSVDLDVAGLADFGPRGNYFRRQIDRWTAQYQASATEIIPAMDALIGWLDRHVPDDDGRISLVHGDFRIDNLLFAPDGPACRAVLDWELATLGHPLADLAAVIMQWRLPVGPGGRGLAGVDRHSAGLPSDADFIAGYCQRMGQPMITDFGFYLAFAFFRMAAILQGVKRRALDGNGSNPEKGLRMGALVPAYAEAGLEAATQR